MREYKNQSISFSDPLSLALSRRERGLLDILRGDKVNRRQAREGPLEERALTGQR